MPDGLTFVPFQCDDAKHVAELKRQRTCCGWDLSDEIIDIWLKDCRAGDKLIWWLFLDSGNLVLEPNQKELLNVQVDGKGTYAPPPPCHDFTPIGHIALSVIVPSNDVHKLIDCLKVIG